MDGEVGQVLLPARSSVALVANSLVGAVLLEWTSSSLLSVLSTVALVAIITSYLWATIASFTNRPGPPVPGILREGVSEGQVKRLVEQATPLLNKALAVAYRLAVGKDLLLTAQVSQPPAVQRKQRSANSLPLMHLNFEMQVGLVLFVISRLSALLSIISALYLGAPLAAVVRDAAAHHPGYSVLRQPLPAGCHRRLTLLVCIAVVLLAFSAPKLYELKKTEIDAAIKTVHDQVSLSHAADCTQALVCGNRSYGMCAFSCWRRGADLIPVRSADSDQVDC